MDVVQFEDNNFIRIHQRHFVVYQIIELSWRDIHIKGKVTSEAKVISAVQTDKDVHIENDDSTSDTKTTSIVNRSKLTINWSEVESNLFKTPCWWDVLGADRHGGVDSVPLIDHTNNWQQDVLINIRTSQVDIPEIGNGSVTIIFDDS